MKTIEASNDATGPAFQLLQDGSLFLPYGRFPHRKGLQIFEKPEGYQLAEAFNSALNRLQRWVAGASNVAVYIGHPDDPEAPAGKYPDSKAYGWVQAINAEDDGVRLPVKWTPEGEALVKNGHYRFYSPRWWMRPHANGAFRVSQLVSVGLTNTPNTPVPALSNDITISQGAPAPDQTTKPKTKSMNPELLKALGLDDTATDEQIIAAANELAARAQSAADAETQLTAANERTGELETQLTAANDQRDAERRLRIADGINPLIETGRIVEAERAEIEARLLSASNDEFAAALTEYGRREATIKTASETGDLGEQKGAIHAANERQLQRNKRQELVDAEIARGAPTPDIAWQRAASKDPELFGQKASA